MKRMRMGMWVAAGLVGVMLAGCATPGAITAKAMDAQIAQMAKPTFAVEMSDTGMVKKIEYHDPRDRVGMATPTNGWDFGNSLLGTVERVTLGAAPWVAVGAVAVKGIRNAGHNSSSVTTATTTNTTTETTTNTASGDGAATGGTASFHTEQIGPDSQNSTSTDSHAVDDHSVTDSHDATAAPTVVQVPAGAVVP